MKNKFFFFLLIFLFGFNSLYAQNPQTAAALFEQGKKHMADEDWYSAAETLIECLRKSPAHAEATIALAESYYALGEYDEALNWTGKARLVARGNVSVAVLEASVLTALGRLDAASAIITEVLAREPYNREALFAAGELDIARGRTTEAVLRYRGALGRFPDDRQLLLSLALVTGSLGDNAQALSFINRALARHPDDHRVFYYAAYINAAAGRVPQAADYSLQALRLKPDFTPARSLLAKLRFRGGQFTEASDIADELIKLNRNDLSAWYIKGLSLIRLGRNAEAISILGNALGIDPNNEFIRAALEDTIISSTALEDARRVPYARWHFDRARDFKKQNMTDQALFEYRRGLRLNPYAHDRREYADLLRQQGYPARYLEQLKFLQEQGLEDRRLSDAVETYSSLLSGALYQRWQVNPVDLDGRHWKIAVFSLDSHSSFIHVDAGAVASAYIKEILIHDRNIIPMDLALRQPSLSSAFRTAREAGADYFLLVTAMENERDISLKGELFVARTGAAAASFNTYRTGIDRLRNSCRGIADQLGASLPFRASLVMRRQDQGLIDKGKADGIEEGLVYDIVKKGRSHVASQGIGLVYSDDDIAGKITIENIGEEVSSGKLARQGFFDRIEAGDEVLLRTTEEAGKTAGTAVNPELRSLLRTLK